MQLPSSYRDRILTEQNALSYSRSGWRKADLHVHSTCSPDVLPCPDFQPEQIYRTARQRGLDYLSITDHDSMDAYDLIGWEREGLVPGVEITLQDWKEVGHTLHINVYQLNRSQFTELEQIAMEAQSLELFIQYLRDQQLPYIYNHPFWFAKGETPNLSSVLDIIDLFPAVEYNMKRVQQRNWMALWLAAHHGKGILANTDTHIGEMGATYTLARGETFDEYFEHICTNQACIVPRDMDVDSLNEEIATWIEKFFESEGMEGKTFRITKNRMLDQLLNFFASHPRTRYPILFNTTERMVQNVARTGIISRMFVSMQNRRSRRICRTLDMPVFAEKSTE